MPALRLAYADPPYPGCAHLYPENTEVDHGELIARLERDYDGWALSTNENTLAQVLALAPADVRILAWCKSDAAPFQPNPWYSWEPVLCRPARTQPVVSRSYLVCPGPARGFCAADTLVGAKPRAFCQWIIRCLGAERDDTLDDVFPGTGVMGETWARWVAQPELFALPSEHASWSGSFNMMRRHHPQLPGMEPGPYRDERPAARAAAARSPQP